MSGNSDSQVEVKIVGSVDGSLATSTQAATQQIDSIGTASKQANARVAVDYQGIINSTTGVTRETKSARDSFLAFGAAISEQKALARTAEELENVGQAATRAGHAVGSSRAAYEALVVTHEAMQGRLSRIPGSLMILAQASGVASMATIGLVAAAAVAVGVIGYLEYKAYETAQEINRLGDAFEASGRGAEFGTGMVQMQLEALRDMPEVSTKVAEGLLQFEAAETRLSASVLNSTNQLTEVLVREYGEKWPEAMQKLLHGLDDLSLNGFEKLNREMLHLNPTQIEAIETLLVQGRTFEAVTGIINSFAANHDVKLQSLIQKQGELVVALKQAKDAYEASLAPGYTSAEMVAGLRQAEEDLQKQLDDTNRSMREQQGILNDQSYGDAVGEAIRLNAEGDKRAALLRKLATDQGFLNQAVARGDQVGQKAFAGQIAGDLNKLADIQKQQDEVTLRTYNSGQEAMVASSRAGSAARIAAAQREADEAKRLFGDQSEAYQNAMRKLGDEQRAAADRATALRRKESEDERRAEDERVQIAESGLRTELELQRIGIAQKRAMLEQQVSDGTISKLQELQQLRALIQEEYADQLAAARAEMALVKAKPVAYAQAAGQIKIIEANLAKDLAVIDNQLAVATKAATQQDVRSWKTADQEIYSSEDTLVRDLWSGRKTLVQSLVGLASNLVEKEIAADLKYYTQHLLLSKTELATDKALEQGGWLVHLLGETTKTTATVAGVTARTAAVTEGAAAGTAAQAAAGSVAILNDAYQAAAGTYSAVAQIPYVGPYIAPAAAAVAFAAVASFDTLASLDTGTMNVPHDMLAQIHEGEGVIPKPFMQGFREMVGGNGSPASLPPAGGDLHVHLPGPAHKSMTRGDIIDAVATGKRLGDKRIRNLARGK